MSKGVFHKYSRMCMLHGTIRSKSVQIDPKRFREKLKSTGQDQNFLTNKKRAF